MKAADRGPGPDATPGKPADPRLAGLLRWYPRAWRDRYGDEFLAMVEDTLDGRGPGWRLHLDVIRAGLRERARRAVSAALTRQYVPRHRRGDGPPPELGRMGLVTVMIVVVGFWSLQNLGRVSLSAGSYRQARGSVSADAITGLCVVVGVAVAAGGLAAGPAFARFLRAGGWRGIRRQVAWAAGATAVGTGALAGLILLMRSMTFEQVAGSPAYWSWLVATLVPLGAAVLLWRQVAMTVAGHLDLPPGVRAVHVMLKVLATTATDLIMAVLFVWYGQIHADHWLLGLGLVYLVVKGRPVPGRLWWAWRRGQQLRAAGSGPGGAAE